MPQFSISYSFKVQPALTAYQVVYGTSYSPNAINDLGKIAGGVPSGHGASNSFTYDTATNTLDTNLESPLNDHGGTRWSSLGGINDLGQLAGSPYFPIPGAPGTVGILITSGNTRTFTFPGSVSTQALGLNNLGQVAGIYTDSSGTHGFAGPIDQLHAVNVPNAHSTEAQAINDWGDVVGSYNDTNGDQHGFVETPDGQFSTIDAPNARSTTVTGINDWGQIVGSYTDSGGGTHGFVETFGQFQTLDMPNATRTDACGINNLGQIVGMDIIPGTNPGGGAAQFIQTWVAKPSFLPADSGGNTALPLASSAEPWLPDNQELSSLVQALSSGNWNDLVPNAMSATNPIAAAPSFNGNAMDLAHGGVPAILLDAQSHWTMAS